MDWFGHLMICVAAVLSAAGGALTFAGNDSPPLLVAGKRMLHAAAIASAITLLALVFLLLTHDYRVSYVRDYVDRTMTVGYQFMAIWGGQEGSLLLWACIQTFFTSAMMFLHLGRSRKLLPSALGILAMIQTFFLLLVLFHSNPFTPLGTLASHGIGLNPLLRNPYMAVHPPTLYIGFVGFAVPMAFALAALFHGDHTRGWITDLRGTVLFTWIFLGVGNVLGMVWAYEELDWGGFWGWDPVENASFMPWLTGTALLHSYTRAAKGNRFYMWSLVLTWLTFSLTVFGTFLTRSGVIQSVHAFAGSTTGPFLLGLIACSTIVFVGLVIWRWREFERCVDESSWFSRTQLFSLTNIVFVAAAAFVWFATMAPLFTEVLRGEKVAVTPAFFNQWMVPLGLAILVLIGLCFLAGRVGNKSASVLRHAALPFGGGLLVLAITLIIWGKSEWKWQPLVAAFWIGAVGVSLIQEIGRLWKKADGHDFQTRRLGAHLIHLAMVLCFVGFAGTAYQLDEIGSLRPGQSLHVGRYELQFVGLRETNDIERYTMLADVDVRVDGKSAGILSPSRNIYHSHPGRPTSEVVIRTGLFEDLFLTFGDGDVNTGSAVIHGIVNPLVIWIWIGGVIMVIGTVFASGWVGSLRTWLNGIRLGTPRQRMLGSAGAALIAGLVGIGLGKDLATAVMGFTGIAVVGMAWLLTAALLHMASGEGRS